MTTKHIFYDEKPGLNLDFENTKSLDPRIAFSRASTGTYVDKDGIIRIAAVDEPRINYDPEIKVHYKWPFLPGIPERECLGLLVEESRTNIARQSQNISTPPGVAEEGRWNIVDYTVDNISNPYGAPGQGTLIPNTAVAPDGTLTASFFSAIDINCLRSPFLASANINQAVDALVVDLSTGTVVSAGLNVNWVKITSFSNDWYRVAWGANLDTASVYLKRSTTNIVKMGVYAFWGGLCFTFITGGAEGQGVFIWGAQLEAGSFSTSYIPTTGVAATRAPDLAEVQDTGFNFDTVLLNKPFGCASGSKTLTLVGPNVQRVAQYAMPVDLDKINDNLGKVDDFWQWTIDGTSFALSNFTTDGQVTVDWGDGVVEVLTTAEHTFQTGGLHTVGFRLDSGTYFRPIINQNTTHKDKVLALGPAPSSMVLDGYAAFYGCIRLAAFDPTIDATGGTNFSYAWNSCNSLTSFPLIDTSSGINFAHAWSNCNSLTSFPLINTSGGTDFTAAWNNCNSLTTFPLVDTSSGINFNYAWYNCNSLTSFSLIDTSSGTNFVATWYNCSSLTSFPPINTSSGTNFIQAWFNCNELTTFPLVDTSSGTNFTNTWYDCSNLTTFPLIDTSSGIDFSSTWYNCSSLTSFPLIDTSSGTIFNYAWSNCTSLTSFPLIDTSSGTNFYSTWNGCTQLTSFPLLDTSSGIDFGGTWNGCNNLTTFPLIDTSGGTNFGGTWFNCNELTTFPLVDTSSGENFSSAWYRCNSLTSFPPINTSSGTSFTSTWYNCSSLTSFPLIDTSSGTIFNYAWQNCINLTSFPANMFDTTGVLVANAFESAFTNCALTAQSVENILVSLDTNGATGITLNINGGTTAGQASWTPAATTAYNNLIAKGWTIIANP